MMGSAGVGGGHFAHFIGAGRVPDASPQISAARAHFDEMYGSDWRERALKTLEQELRDRGLDPKSGDDGYQVVPTPRIVGDRIVLGFVCSLIAFLGICACWAWWEYLP